MAGGAAVAVAGAVALAGMGWALRCFILETASVVPAD
jgi:hypothetical protein